VTRHTRWAVDSRTRPSVVGTSTKCNASTKQFLLATLSEQVTGNVDEMNTVAWFLILPKTACVEDGIYASALAAQAIALQPENATFQNTSGLACFRAGEMEKARAALEKSLSMSTAWAGADWYVLAMVCKREGKTPEAIEYLKKAKQWRHEKQPNFPDLRLLEAEAQELISVD
jgi:tetratricopeptide (TPR) repeat protein